MEFCKKCGAMLEPAEEADQNLKLEEQGKFFQYCLECAGWIKLAQLFEDQPEPAELES